MKPRMMSRRYIVESRRLQQLQLLLLVVFAATIPTTATLSSRTHYAPRIGRMPSGHQPDADPMAAATANLLRLNSANIDALLRLPRGGASRMKDIVLDDDDDHTSLVKRKVRNVIRNVVDTAPLFIAWPLQFFLIILRIIGLDLMSSPTTAPGATTSSSSLSTGRAKKRRRSTVSKSNSSSRFTTKNNKTKATAKSGSAARNTTNKSSTRRQTATSTLGPSRTKTKVAPAATTTTSATTKSPSSSKNLASIHVRTPIKPTNQPNFRVQRELHDWLTDPPAHVAVQVGANLCLWVVTLHGAPGTIYEQETFKLRVRFPPDYPTVPPSVYFLPPHIPVHEHVYTNGDICLSLLGKDWRPTMTAQSIVLSILSILSSAQSKTLPMDNARHALNKPGEYQKDWVYHDDNC